MTQKNLETEMKVEKGDAQEIHFSLQTPIDESAKLPSFLEDADRALPMMGSC